MKKVLLILAIAFTVRMASASTAVSKVIAGNEIWTASNSPYILSENCAILSGASVTVMPGVEIKASTGFFTLAVHGGFFCFGKKDSMIAINSVLIQFNSTALSYNPKTGKGCQINYTGLNPGGNTYAITTTNCDFLVDHCVFENYTYCIYNMGSTDTTNFFITNSKFKGKGYGYIIMGMYNNSYLEFTGNTSEYNSYIYMAEKNIIKNNYFLMSGSSYALYLQSYTREADVQCNYFKGGYYGIYAGSLSSMIKSVNIKNNEFDSCNYVFYLSCSQGKNDSIHFHSNNMKRYSKSIYISGCTGSKTLWYDVTGNYWGTTDSAIIIASLVDNRTSSTMPVKANINSPLSSPVSTCWPTIPGSLNALNGPTKSGLEMRILPNPAIDLITIQMPVSGNYHVVIYNISGMKIATNDFTGNEVKLMVNSLGRGNYIVMVNNEKGITFSQKIMVD